MFRIKTFSGTAREDPLDFTNDLEHMVRKEYQRAIAAQPLLRNLAEEIPNLIETEKAIHASMKEDLKVNFRQSIAGQAEEWYYDLNRSKRQEWLSIREAFLRL